MANSFDFVVRFVPHYGFLPIIVIHDRADGKTRELYRGEFKPTAIDALAACNHIVDQVARNVPELRKLLDTPGMSCQTCRGPVEPERKCFAVPTCFKCLPPPPPMERVKSFEPG